MQQDKLVTHTIARGGAISKIVLHLIGSSSNTLGFYIADELAREVNNEYVYTADSSNARHFYNAHSAIANCASDWPSSPHVTVVPVYIDEHDRFGVTEHLVVNDRVLYCSCRVLTPEEYKSEYADLIELCNKTILRAFR